MVWANGSEADFPDSEVVEFCSSSDSLSSEESPWREIFPLQVSMTIGSVRGASSDWRHQRTNQTKKSDERKENMPH